MKKEFDITGMTCASCQSNIQKAVCKIKGVKKADVNLVSNSMQVECDDKLDSSTIIKKVESIGYGASEKGVESRDLDLDNRNDKAKNELKKQRISLIISIVLLLPLFYIAMGPMVGLPNFPFFDGVENALIFALAQLVLTSIILLINKHFFIRGFKALFKLVPNMDSLIAIGAGSAYIYGIAIIFIMSYAFGRSDLELVHEYMHSLYFEGAATIVTLVSLGKYFENRAKIKTSSEISKLMKLAPKTCTIIKNGEESIVDVSSLVVGDVIVIRPGDVLPVDGVILSGNGLLDQSAITGESLPVDKKVGDEVISASINKNGTFTFKAAKIGKETTISKIIALVEKASSTKAPIAKIADKVSAVFVPIVIAISLISLIVWLIITKDFAFSLNFAISVLVISCPCALGLATPLAIMVGTGKAAQYGILVKDAENLENLCKIDTIVLDKTGTITTGSLSVTDVYLANNDIDENELIMICASIEKHSNHPLAKAVVDYAVNRVNTISVEDYEEIAGKGTKAIINGKEVLLGNEKLVSDVLNKDELKQVKDVTEEFALSGKTPIICVQNKKLLGIIALADTIREDSVMAIKELKNMGLNVIMLTGDNETTAKAFARNADIENVIANVLPDQKYEYVEQIKGQGHRVAMVGDGINDSPALKAADIGIAIGSGTDIAMESAGIVLIKNSLLDLVIAIRLSKRTITNIKMSLFWAFFYNALGIPLAAGVFYPLIHMGLSPMIASLAMSLSSVCVVINALTLRIFNPNRRTRNIVKKKEEIMEKTITIEGMSCNHCKMKVENALKDIKGVTSVSVDLESKQAVITMSKEVKDKVFTKTIEKLGYKVI